MNLNEEYVHFQESITSLNRSWRILCELENAPSGNAIWSAAYRMVIVEYCKPFTISQINENERYTLPLPNLPDEAKNFHARLLKLRNQVMAHSDLRVLDAKVFYDQTDEYPVPLIVQNVQGNFPKVSEIRNQVEAVLDALYQQGAQYELRFKERP
ncbi:MAG: hypothetical protein GYB18_02015 [Oceanospirillales bacterium]|nr:hypothetical protein [Oceanospirillales bacterium]